MMKNKIDHVKYKSIMRYLRFRLNWFVRETFYCPLDFYSTLDNTEELLKIFLGQYYLHQWPTLLDLKESQEIVVLNLKTPRQIIKFYDQRFLKKQVINQKLIALSPCQIVLQYPDLYHNSILHFGSLPSLFRHFGRRFPYLDIFLTFRSLCQRIKPFLGLLPDLIVGDCLGVQTKDVRIIREKYKILSFSRKKSLNKIFQKYPHLASQ